MSLFFETAFSLPEDGGRPGHRTHPSNRIEGRCFSYRWDGMILENPSALKFDPVTCCVQSERSHKGIAGCYSSAKTR